MSLEDLMSRLFNLSQKDNKDLLDYSERFKEERNISKTQIVKHFIYSFIKNTTEYIKLEKIQKEAHIRKRHLKNLWQFCLCEVPITQYMENLLNTSEQGIQWNAMNSQRQCRQQWMSCVS